MTVGELVPKLTMREYMGWLAYFQRMNGKAEDEDDDLLKEFKL